jgi:hypothetical protein
MTEDEVIQLLEQADPVRWIEPGPTVDADGYLDALRTRGTTVTLTHTGPTAKPGRGHRRRWPIITVAAAVVAIVVGGVALVARDRTSDTHSPAGPSATVPATTTTATPAEEAAAEETARAFIDAENAYDVDRMLTYFDREPENLDELRLQVAWDQAVGTKKLNVHCRSQGESAAGIDIFCTYDDHSLRSDEAGFGPYAGYSEFTIRDGKIGPAESDITESASARFSSEMEKPFHWWMSANHPDDVAVMYEGSEPRISEDSIPLWEQRTREYVATGDVPRPLPALALMPGELYSPGTYYIDEVNGTPTPRIFATLDAGWTDMVNGSMWMMAKVGGPEEGGIGVMTINNPVAVFSDACHPTGGFHPGPVDTVDGFVTALMEQQGWAEVTAPSDISVDGYVGKAFQRTTPAVMSECTTVDTGDATFESWETADGDSVGYAPGQIETLWVLDIDGTVVVISAASSPGPSGTIDAGFADAVLDSIRIERP